MSKEYPGDHEYCNIYSVVYYTSANSTEAQNIAAKSFDCAVNMLKRVQGSNVTIQSVTLVDQFAWWNLNEEEG